MENKIFKPKTIKILDYVIKVNQVWFVGLAIGVALNIYFNISNHLKNKNLVKEKIELIEKIDFLEEKNRELTASVQALMDNMVMYNRTFDEFDLEVWSKVKKGDTFYSNYYNLTYEENHFKPFGTNRYAKMGQTDYENTKKWIADFWFKDDLEVALTGESGVYKEPYELPNGEVRWGYFYKWSKIPDDTLVYGMKLPKKN